MAKPTAALELGEVKLEVYDANVGGWSKNAPLHMYYIYRLPIMPQWWADETPQSVGMWRDDLPMRVKYTHEAYHDETDGDGTLTIQGFTSQETQASFTRSITAAIASPTWQAEDEDTKYPIHCQEFTNTPGSNPPLFMVAKVQYSYTPPSTPANNQAEIGAVNIETVIDSPGTDKLPWFGHASNKLYEPDMPASAWHVAHCICQGFNALLDENKPIFSTIPVGWYDH